MRACLLFFYVSSNQSFQSHYSRTSVTPGLVNLDVSDEIVSDSENEVVPDSENEVVPDSENEVVPDSENEVVPDSENEVVPDSENEVVPDSENEVVPDSEDEEMMPVSVQPQHHPRPASRGTKRVGRPGTPLPKIGKEKEGQNVSGRKTPEPPVDGTNQQQTTKFAQTLDQPLHTEKNITFKGQMFEKSRGQGFKLELLAEEKADEKGMPKPAAIIPLQIIGTFENDTITVKASKVSEGKPIEEKVKDVKYNKGDQSDQVKIFIDVRKKDFKVYVNDEAVGGIPYSDLLSVKKIAIDGYIGVNSVVVKDRIRRKAIPLSPDELRVRQDTMLAALNARRGDATGDGNCLYNSISLVLYGNEQANVDLRRECIEHMVKNAERFVPRVLSHIEVNKLSFETFEAYIANQKKDKIWAEFPEIESIADYLGQEIHIYHTNNDPTIAMRPQVAKPETKPIRLLYNGQTHYDAIIERDEKDRSPEADDAYAEDLEMEVDIPGLPEAENEDVSEKDEEELFSDISVEVVKRRTKSALSIESDDEETTTSNAKTRSAAPTSRSSKKQSTLTLWLTKSTSKINETGQKAMTSTATTATAASSPVRPVADSLDEEQCSKDGENEKLASDDKQVRIKELKGLLEILSSKGTKKADNAVIIKNKKVAQSVVCRIKTCNEVVLKVGMPNNSVNAAVQDHIAKHFCEVNNQCRYICKGCGEGYSEYEKARNHYRKGCKNMDKKKYLSCTDGMIDNINDWPFDSVVKLAKEVFDDESFITRLPKITVDKWKVAMQKEVAAFEADTFDWFKIPDNGLVKCLLCGDLLNFEYQHSHSVQMLADHFFPHLAKEYGLWKHECECGYKGVFTNEFNKHTTLGPDKKRIKCGKKTTDNIKTLPTAELEELSLKMFNNSTFYADVFSNMNPEWTTKTWTAKESKSAIIEAMLTSGNVYNLPGHYYDLLKNHLVDKNLTDLGAKIVEEMKVKAKIMTKGKHYVYTLVDGQHLRELLEQKDFDKMSTDPIIYVGKGSSTGITDPIDAVSEFVDNYDGRFAKKYRRLMASLLNGNDAPIYKVLIEVESAELQTTAEASLIAALLPFDITNENRGKWSSTRTWTSTEKRAVGIHFFNILSEKLKKKDYEPAKIFNIEKVTGEVSDAANMEEQRKRVEKRQQLAPAKLQQDIRDMADLERVKRGEKWHDELAGEIGDDQSSIYWLSDSREIPEARREADLATCQKASIYVGAKGNETKKDRDRRMYDHGRKAKIFDALESKMDFMKVKVGNIPKCERLIEVGKSGANTLILEIGKLSNKQHIAAEWALINSSIGSTATNCFSGDESWPTVLPDWDEEKKREFQLYWIDRLVKAVQNDQFERESIEPCDVLAILDRDVSQNSCSHKFLFSTVLEKTIQEKEEEFTVQEIASDSNEFRTSKS
ncbi:hypothetical protein WR25_02487 [Diploscapter pachys]|uniref:OTU domain-containing protein n=1 Tax=Diploscapter pachys TaxID=2018661 RepID=A0A2A2KNS4_9BILA|nr:hypothetical protein WR25_02487 [Diploscapter pachys]